ncbi:MAG TPA: PstS family phosphate ABC transporter substrate-binding protein [Gammaproteobacteria bacterium]|nr:PstS family phosphate ABC transporter substrate-binding protein [Gammaproteobacteria bacterium]
MNKVLIATAMTVVLAANAYAAGRSTISVVGSSTVYPFATVVAERFGKKTSYSTPKIESTGSGGGMKLFCNGVGLDTPDITNASRRIKKSEFDKCQANGVKDIIEIKIGYDGIAVANSNSASQFKLTRKDLYLALAKTVPNPDGSKTLVANPYKTWKQVNSSLPDNTIEVLGPPPTSGTRDAFVELVMEHGCETFEFVDKMDKPARKAACQTVREDGPYIEAGENDNLIVQKLERNANALGIFGFSFLEQNDDKIQGSLIEGKTPTFESIADGSYPISRPLFFYVKKAHVGAIPGIAEYLAEFTSEAAMGEDGYLIDKGLIPLSDSKRQELRADIENGKTLSM